MNVESEQIDQTYYIRLSGTLDINTIPGVEEILEKYYQEGGSSLLIDLSETEYLTSAGLRVLLRARKHMDSISGDVAILNPHHNTRDVLELSGINRLFTLFETREEALAALKST